MTGGDGGAGGGRRGAGGAQRLGQRGVVGPTIAGMAITAAAARTASSGENTDSSAMMGVSTARAMVSRSRSSFMENVCEWHGKAPCQEEADQALKEIRRCSCEQ